jgi:hypothetical protein
VSAEINVGSIASKEAGVCRVDADAGKVTLTVNQKPVLLRDLAEYGYTVSPMTPSLTRALAQLLLVAAERAEGL